MKPKPDSTGTASPPDDKRVLRSQDHSVRPKSELAYFFPNYEDIVLGEFDQPENLTLDTAILITDRKLPSRNLAIRSPPAHRRPQHTRPQHTLPTSPARPTKKYARPGRPKLSAARNFNGFERRDMSAALKKAATLQGDPLADSHFIKSHKRAERREKNLRNIERDRAMHEKYDLDRLLAELRGPEWIRTMGVSAITDSEKRKYEPKRQLMITSLQALIQKFADWKEKEKALRLKRSAETYLGLTDSVEHVEAAQAPSESSELPDEDADASAARQLLMEAKLRTPKPAGPVPPLRDERPFTSFFDKRYLRQAALGSQRKGRSVRAFGYPLPELADGNEFNLPSEFLTEENLIANARKRRRLKRASKDPK